jgi:CheY-like chemotaxis protein
MKKILIVDDLRPFIEQQKTILSRSDVHIFTATSGHEALSIHKNVKVDLIVADLDMPGMSGDELCSLIRKDPELRFVSFLMVTRLREADIARFKKSGANDFITKPIQANVLIEKTTALLGVPVRKSYRVIVNVSVTGEKEQSKFIATSVNISTGGILIETKKVLNVGDMVNCSFFLPGTSVISATGEVVRAINPSTSDSHRYGIRFTIINDAQRLMIDNFIKSHSSIGH